MGVLEMAKAGAAAVPGTGRLPFLPGGGGEIPELEQSLEAQTADLDRLATYAEVCGFTLRNTLPVTWPHIAAFNLHMKILTDGRFPFGPIGLVHIANEITQHRPIGVSERLTVSARTSPAVAHPRGRAFSLLSQARVGDEVVWEERSTMLRREGGNGSTSGRGPAEDSMRRARAGDDRDRGDARPGGVPPIAAWWNLPGDLGSRYGGVSGDRNPIHLHPLTAKAFGFPGAIAHGMWTKARCLAALESILPDSYTVRVRFAKPIVLPARVGFTHQPGKEPGEVEFLVLPKRDGSTHLTGAIKPVIDASRET